ncbi:MAG: carboxymuconolactone decarboxylase family protein [Kineosporiaceae bacterium]|nr:carboxymuconolactone decarboxylase family protein [Kineosporiaceae bacterium]MBK8074165.1 carboxymuconolactone decarboxylase family protein [Kineosporiaceae bacterium]
MPHGHDVLAGLRDDAAKLRSLIPEVYDGYTSTRTAALHDGALSAKVKELMALSIAISKQCDGCIAAHAKSAARAGATIDEAAEAIGVALVMNGGPATVHGPRALASFLEFREHFDRLKKEQPRA